MTIKRKGITTIIEEEAISQVLDQNKWDLTKRGINYDLVTCGIGAVKTDFNLTNGVTVKYEPIFIFHKP